MTMERSPLQVPTVVAEVTFFTAEEGGRTRLPDLSQGGYAPHLVVQRSLETGRTAAGGEFLGVWFTPGASEPAPGDPFRCVLVLMYHPQADYAALRSGVNFTIQEGPHVVGFGTVLSRRGMDDTNP